MHELTATDELRSLLDERGVEWWPSDDRQSESIITHWRVGFIQWTAIEGEKDLWLNAGVAGYDPLTPEQAIAATLGRGMLTADDVRDLIERHSDASGGNGRDFHNGAYVAIADELNATLGSCNCSNNCTNGERTDAPRLPHFWTHDGALHIELPKLPESISVRLPDQRDREVGSARTWQYMRDSGTCKVDVLNTGDCAGYECSEYIMHCNGCGHEFGHVLYNEDGDVWMSEKPRYCPNCGRRIEVDE